MRSGEFHLPMVATSAIASVFFEVEGTAPSIND